MACGFQSQHLDRGSSERKGIDAENSIVVPEPVHRTHCISAWLQSHYDLRVLTDHVRTLAGFLDTNHGFEEWLWQNKQVKIKGSLFSEKALSKRFGAVASAAYSLCSLQPQSLLDLAIEHVRMLPAAIRHAPAASDAFSFFSTVLLRSMF